MDIWTAPITLDSLEKPGAVFRVEGKATEFYG